MSGTAWRFTFFRIRSRFRWWHWIVIAIFLAPATWLILTQVRVNVGLCGKIVPGGLGVSSCLGGTVEMSIWDYITHSKYPDFDYVLAS